MIISQCTHQRQWQIKSEEVVGPTLWMLHHSGCSSSHLPTVHSTSLFSCWYMTWLCMTRHWGLQQSDNQYWKRHLTYLQKSCWYLPSSPRKIVHRMSSICLVYIGYWQHSPEIETSSKLECIYHEPLTNKMYKLWNFLKLDMFSVFIFAYIHSPLLPLSMPFFTSATMS